MIVTSTYTEGPIQADGRRYVKETHTDDQGVQYDYEWLGSQNAETVLQARAQKLNELIKEQRDVEEAINGTMLPLTKLQFRELFTTTERMGIDALHASFESREDISAEHKAAIRTGLEDYRMAQNMKRPFDERVQNMLGLYQAFGLLTAERVAEIMGSGNG